MRYLLDAVYLIIIVVSLPILLARKSRRGLAARLLGRTNIRSSSGKPKAPVLDAGAFGLPPNGGHVRIWFHGVSVGEVHLLRTVVKQFRMRHPSAECIVSSTTDTGFEEARKCFPDLPVIRWPLDFSWAVERSLREVRPNLVVLAEGEWWPNFLLAAKRRQIPVVAVNVRMSPQSFRCYQRFRSLARHWLGLVSHFAVQTEEYAAGLRRLGVEPHRLTVTGSVKYDGVQGDRSNPKTTELRRLFRIAPNELVWVAGSTQEPEEEIALDVFQRLRARHANLRLILVPRQRDRFDEVAALLQARGVAFVRRSELAGERARLVALASRLNEVVLIDTIGELAAAWGLADVAFVGGSLDGRRGGQNMIEPTAYGAAVLFGPHTWNFRDTAQRLLDAGGALVVDDAVQLEAAVGRLLTDAGERRRLGEVARTLVQSQQGATERTLTVLTGWLRSEQASRAA